MNLPTNRDIANARLPDSYLKARAKKIADIPEAGVSLIVAGFRAGK